MTLQTHDESKPVVEIVYNKEHGLLVNDVFHDIDLSNITKAYMILHNNTLYLSGNGATFADIILAKKIDYTSKENLTLYFDAKYSQDIEISKI